MFEDYKRMTLKEKLQVWLAFVILFVVPIIAPAIVELIF